ncbi:MAG: VirB3 family type IV secretion system protein [Pseudomonadota bacterium]
MPTFHDPIFRGCTRPAMFAGVPMLPFLLVTGVFMLATVWTFYLASAYVALFLIMAYVPILLAMRQVTRRDDQRLRQLLLRARMRVRQRAGRALWGASSYAPLRYKQRKGA